MPLPDQQRGRTLRLLIVSLLSIAGTCSSQSLYRELNSTGQGANVPPPQLRNVAIEQKLNKQVPLDLQFKDEAGRDVSLSSFTGKRPIVLVLVYYACPRLCTLELTGFLKTARALPFNIGKEYEVVTVSFDPRDTPAKAAAKKVGYIEGYNRRSADEGWHFLVGDERNIQRLTHAVGFKFDYDDRTDLYSHASAIMVLTPQGRVSRYFYGIEYPPRDLRLALVEASSGKIGSRVDQVLLYCFHYDPSTGRYSLAVMRSIQAGGVLTMALLFSFVFMARRRDQTATPKGHL
jgi:protein SCO1/2